MSRSDRVVSLLRWMIASEDARNPLKTRKQRGFIRMSPATYACKKGMIWWNQGSLRRRKCNVRRSRFLASPAHIGWLVPPLERLERREEPEAQGGEFVEAYVAKRTKQIS
ncbi:MAG: hypothetical protein CL920_38315, partial [Deltaproteobacteria bacterium]|nr:hypothetical protein [Deltaproteobacteria bacterium]